MKKFTVFYLIVLSCLNLNGQTTKLFNIVETTITDSLKFKTTNDFEKASIRFYEDEKYIVRKTCSGEWGGTIWFKNKENKKEYSCEANCPVTVYKIDGKYIVTNTLAHGIGFSKVLEIDDPQRMTIFKRPRAKFVGGRFVRYVGSDESRSTIGSRQLIDSTGVFTLVSFPYKGELFYIVTDFHKTFVTKIQNNKFVTIDTISNESIWTYDPEVIRTKDNHIVVFFKNSKVKGYIDIIENQIKLTKYK